MSRGGRCSLEARVDLDPRVYDNLPILQASDIPAPLDSDYGVCIARREGRRQRESGSRGRRVNFPWDTSM